MSNDDHLRRVTQDLVRNSPSTQKPTEQQVPDYHDRQVINNEIDRIRREQQERR